MNFKLGVFPSISLVFLLASFNFGLAIADQPDPTSWTQVYSGASGESLDDVAFGNGRFMAVGEGLNVSTKMVTSVDGSNWTELGRILGLWGTAIGWCNNTWIMGAADNSSAAPGHILRSTNNGTSWNDVGVLFEGEFADIACNASTGQSLAVGDQHTICASNNGASWDCDISGDFRFADATGAVFHNGKWIVVYDDEGIIQTSTDGQAWTTVNSRNRHVFKAVHSDGNLAVAVGYARDVRKPLIYHSSDGATWTQVSLTTNESSGLVDVVKTSQGWIAMGGGSSFIATSTDGINWSTEDMSLSLLDHIAYSPNADELVGVAVSVYKAAGGSQNDPEYDISISKTGTGSGSVEANPIGIDCGPGCETFVQNNLPITLTATADAGSIFEGWSGGGCDGFGTDPCVISSLTSDLVVTASFTVLDDPDVGLIAHFPFNGNAQDESGNGNHAVVTGATPSEDRFGTPDNAYFFDGTDDFISIAHAENINFSRDEDFSVSVWVKASDPQANISDNGIIEKWDENGGYPYVIRYACCTFNGKIVAARYDGANNPSVISTKTVNDGNYHHIVFVKNGSTLFLYIDGELDGSSQDTTTGNTSNSSVVYIGKRERTGREFKGGIDDIHIYDRSLSATEVNQLYDVTNSGLVAYFPFNGNARDESGNGNDGVLL